MSTTSWITAGSAVVVNVLVLIGVLYTARQNRKATKESNAVTADTLEVSKRQQLVENLSEQLDRLWPRLEQMDDTIDEQRGKISHLERENADLRQHTVTCAADVEKLRKQIMDYAARYRVAVAYVQRLHDWMAAHVPGDLLPPGPPESLAFDLADPMHSDAHPPPHGWPPPRE